jgi:hypothetical protein
MHRPVVLFLAIPVIACAWVNDAFAQDPVPYGVPSYGDHDARYDDHPDYDAEQPYDDSYDEQYGETPDQPLHPQVDSIDNFHGALAPYGTWVRSQEFGLIWVPSRAAVGASFVPYATGGRWQYTNVGWMFASDSQWGWATYHYGRWYRDPRYGWSWVPGSVWAPAWVNWRIGGGVVGWAPLPPRHHRTVWVFASARYMNRPNIDRYVYRDAPRYYRTTAPVRHRVRSGRAYWYSGPRRQQIESAARIRIQPIRLRPPRAGVVARVRVDRGRVYRERVAPPRDRAITQSRRNLPPPSQRRPANRASPEVRKRNVWDREERNLEASRPAPRAAPAPRSKATPTLRGRNAPKSEPGRTAAERRAREQRERDRKKDDRR